MSRIYEALLKAESERVSGRQEREPISQSISQLTDFSARSAVAVADREQDGLQLDSLAGLDHSLDPLMDEPSIAPADVLDVSAIRRLPWTPSLAQLPALMDRGVTVEQFRSLRSRIFELRDISPLKSIMVSSGLPQEGKSFVAANLAISLARHKSSKVLLIDGDMRRYTLHQLLGCEPHPGLADYLAGKATLVEVMQRAEAAPVKVENAADKSVYGPMPNLTFIAGGNGGDKAADLSGNPRFGELIRKASPYFDWIIVDSSPVIPVSDAVNLARSCDGVLLVARGGVTKFSVAQRAQSELKASNILGFVLNAVVKQGRTSGYDNYDGYDSYDAETE
jgi:protein-tyrosine kinase